MGTKVSQRAGSPLSVKGLARRRNLANRQDQLKQLKGHAVGTRQGTLNPKVQGSTPCASTIMWWTGGQPDLDLVVGWRHASRLAAFDTLSDT